MTLPTRLSPSLIALLMSSVAAAQTAPAEPNPPAPPVEGPDAGAEGAAQPAPAATVTVAAPTAPAAAATVEGKSTVNVKYDGGLRFSTEDGKYELKLSFRNQARFESNRSFDEETPTRHNQFANRFYVARSRLQAEGHVFGKGTRFKAEIGVGDQGSFGFLKEMFIDVRLPDLPVYVRTGQWRRPFNRQELVSDFASTFNERSIQNDLAGAGRDMGAALHNGYEKSPEGIEWAVGVFNGFSGGADRPVITTTCNTNAAGAITCTNSRPTTFSNDFGPTLAARVGFNSAKLKGYEDGDLEGGPLRYGVALGYKVDLANFSAGTKDSLADNMSHGLQVDAIVKSMGYSLLAAAVMMQVKDADPQYGVLLQPSVVLDKRVELGLRFAMITLTVPGAMMGETIDRNQIEARAAFNYFFHGHAWKFSSDAGFLTLTGSEPTSDRPDLQIRAMMQLQI